MREFVVEQASASLRLTFERMLPSLPGPGTAAFAGLVRQLHPYGLSASGITVDASTSQLSDVAITIPLGGKNMGMRFTCEYFELFVKELFEADESDIISITNHAFDALMLIDEDANQGVAQIRSSSHLKLPPLESKAFLREHFKISESNSMMIPDAVAYNINVPDSNAIAIRAVIAESLAIADAIFIELSREYSGTIIPQQIAEWANTDFERVCELLGLKVKSTE